MVASYSQKKTNIHITTEKDTYFQFTFPITEDLLTIQWGKHQVHETESTW